MTLREPITFDLYANIAIESLTCVYYPFRHMNFVQANFRIRMGYLLWLQNYDQDGSHNNLYLEWFFKCIQLNYDFGQVII